MTSLYKVLRVHEQELWLVRRHKSCRNHEVLSFLLEHECCILEHYRVYWCADLHYIYAVDVLRHILDVILQSDGLLAHYLLHLFLVSIVLLDHLPDGTCKVRNIVEECLCYAE